MITAVILILKLRHSISKAIGYTKWITRVKDHSVEKDGQVRIIPTEPPIGASECICSLDRALTKNSHRQRNPPHPLL